MASRKPLDMGELVRQLGTSEPFRLLDVVRGHLLAAREADTVNLLLVDYALAGPRPARPPTRSSWPGGAGR